MRIRKAREEDLSRMLEIYRPYVEHTTVSFEYETPSLDAFRQRFLEHTVQFPWLALEEDGRILGYAYAGAPWERAAYRWCAEISIYLAESARGKGWGRQLLQALEKILEWQGYRVLYALVTTENEGSVAFHETLGYKLTATLPDCGCKMGRWLGVYYLEKRLGKPELPGAFPRSWEKWEGNL